jgi:serine protease
LLSGVAHCNTSENGCELCPIKVLNSGGSGSYAGVIAGIDKTASDCQSLNKKCVLNMSLGGGKSTQVNTAVNNAVAAGVTVVVAAGNDNRDACNYSPASAENAITVGATTSFESTASYSNYGSCVDFWAPGSSIKSAWINSDTSTNTISGTSMASPSEYTLLMYIIIQI